ncbi:MAG: transporter related protein [Microbacteriaceae bacterium]|jgi:NitT/TauT family transport system ATP-binding protein|nr:transporter related protein [Microbacteriaceae bacterium]
MTESTIGAGNPGASDGSVITRPARIAVQNVTKSYGSRRNPTLVLDTVNLEIAQGEFLCLLGPSGCGKSTLLNIIGGFLTPDSGSVTIDGRKVERPGPDRCMIFQQPALFGWLTALDNVMFGPRAQHKVDADTRDRAMSMLDTVGLAGTANKYPHQLSGGMRQRLSIARALINEPQVLLMDEPFGALDAITRGQMQEFLLNLWAEHHMTVVFVTHDVEEATLLADRVAVMAANPGRIVHLDSVDVPRPRSYDLIDSPEYSRVRMQIRRTIENGGHS